MPLQPANQVITDSDFEAIEAAVKETARGRWFLEEYAQRNRHADTKLVLDAIQRLQRSVLGADTAPPPPAPKIIEVRAELGEIERTADATRKVLTEINATQKRDGNLCDELDHIVDASGQAIAGVLSDADRIAEISSTMRKQGISENICDQLDGLSEHINTACAFQDLTGQRTQRVVVALRLLESRVQELVNLWQAESPVQAPATNALLSGPARDGDGLMQDQVDELLSIDGAQDVFWNEARQPSVGTSDERKTAPQAAAPSPNATQSSIEKLSPEERLALFS